ncbi:hypothetical protein ACJMK2_018189 [Sinanodonta woodiana]|uniref:Calcium-activated chloride channel N-terminal domain-containing protein n=1 Tax=Sinanodonta woodiana TaxID=1069815 RepID=A0ABD3UCM9_SINWO
MKGRAMEENNSMPCDFASMSIYPPNECIFCPDTNQSAKAMDPFERESVGKTLRYTALAPNEQNIRCDYRSAWEIMRNHVDFKEKIKDPRNTETQPIFDVVVRISSIASYTHVYVESFPKRRTAYGSFFVGCQDKDVFLYMSILTTPGDYIYTKVTTPSGYTIIKRNRYHMLGFTNWGVMERTEKGVYHYVVEVDDIADIKVHVLYFTYKNEPKLVTAYSWLPHTIVDYQKETDLKVFVFVKRGMFPVVHANVVAVLRRPDTTAITFDLNDNGIGTDLTKDDGIYTGSIFPYYFTGNGHYSVKIIVTGCRNTKVIKNIHDKLLMCSGEGQSVIYEAIDNFQRVSLLDKLIVTNFKEAFRAETNVTNDNIKEIRTLMLVKEVKAQIALFTSEKNISIIDNIPPSKISNFYQVSYDESEGIRRCFHFRWTAVGNDRDVGQALNNNALVPKIAGDTEELFVIGDVDNTNSLKESFVAINAVDRAGNAAKISNIAIIPYSVNLTIVPLGTKCGKLD